jgi:hypothetical protein
VARVSTSQVYVARVDRPDVDYAGPTYSFIFFCFFFFLFFLTVHLLHEVDGEDAAGAPTGRPPRRSPPPRCSLTLWCSGVPGSQSGLAPPRAGTGVLRQGPAWARSKWGGAGKLRKGPPWVSSGRARRGVAPAGGRSGELRQGTTRASTSKGRRWRAPSSDRGDMGSGRGELRPAMSSGA